MKARSKPQFGGAFTTPEDAALIVQGRMPLLPRFEINSAGIAHAVRPAMTAVAIMPCQLDLDEGRLRQRSAWWFEGSELPSLLGMLLEDAGTRLYLVGCCERDYVDRLCTSGLLPGPVSAPVRRPNALSPVWFLAALALDDLPKMEWPAGDERVNWWSMNVCTGPVGLTEEYLKANTGVSEPRADNGRTGPGASVPWHALYRGCISDATAVLRQQSHEGGGVLVGTMKLPAEELTRRAVRSLDRQCYLGRGGLRQVLRLMDFGLGAARLERRTRRPGS